MKKLLILMFLSRFLVAYGQNYKINWDKNQIITLSNGNAISVPFFTNKENYSLRHDLLPEFVIEMESNTLVDISNIHFSEIENNNDQIDYFIDNEKVNYSIYNVVENNNYEKTIIKILPFVKRSNKFYKVESFSVVTSSERQTNKENLYGRRSLNNNSILRTGNWFKIKVSKDGIFKLDHDFFVRSGIPTSFNPKSLKIYGNGEGRLMENTLENRIGSLQEIPVKFVGENDNSFDKGDYVLFYAKGPHQWYRTDETTAERIKLRYNLYEDYAYYFISYDGMDGKRVPDIDYSASPIKVFSTFDNLQYHKKDSINLNNLGQIWVGESIMSSNGFRKIFRANTIDVDANAYLSYSIVGKNASNTPFSVSVNGESFVGSLGNTSFSVSRRNQRFKLNSNLIDVSISSESTNPLALGYLDYLQLRFKDQLVYNNSQFTFRFLENINNGNVYGLKLANASDVNIWNVSDIHYVSNCLSQNGLYKFSTTNLNEFVAFKEKDAFTDVGFVGRVPNQDIRGLSGINYIIVTHPNYLEQANRLAEFRKKHDKMNVAVVTTDQVYNEFSSGGKDPVAIRDFFKFLKDGQNQNLKYAVLLGATTYDPKNRIKNYTNFIPTFIDEPSNSLENSITTDDYFAMLGNNVKMLANNVDGIYNYDARWLDIAVGRISASNSTEAKILVDKIISYYEKIPNKGTSFGDWRTKVVGVTDNDNNVNTPNFDKTLDDEFNKEENQFYSINKIYVGAHEPTSTSAGVRYPSVNQAIINAIELGSNFLMYYGHGGPRSWAQERIVTSEELSSLSNFNGTYSRLPIVTTVTCDFTVWDLPQYNSAGEMMLKNPNGGALSMITTNRPIGTSYGNSMNGHLIKQFFKKEGIENQSIGFALNNSKKENYPASSYHKSISLLGDPMLSIHRTQQNIEISSMKTNKGVDLLNGGILQALDFVTITGNVLQLNTSTIDANFNGKISINLIEKDQTNTLLSESDWKGKTFISEGKSIYKGTGKVKNGEFTIQFYVSKDIDYTKADRKIKFYAWDESLQKDASVVKNVVMEGINAEGINDKEKPQGKLYMNNLNFANGGITDKSPYLIACLTDNTGINSTGSSIGHDLVATLDGKLQEAYVLNDYYEAGDVNPCVNNNFEDYQKGQVVYQLKNLDLGQHTINFKFWDINNNSNIATLDFVVMENGTSQLHIDKLLNWPNPFTRKTYFHFEHNCSSELNVMVQIFTISGRLVKTIQQIVSAEPFREGYRTGKYAIAWDGLDDFGDKIGKGVYVYKLNVKGLDSQVCKGSATAVEKLVILK